MGRLLKIRYLQFKRELQMTGFLLFILIPVAAYGIYYLYDSLLNEDHAKLILALTILSCLSIQMNRKDLAFVKKQITAPLRELFLEYLVLTLPISLLLLVTGHIYLFVILIACLLLIPGISTFKRIQYQFINIAKWIPARQFEWLSGYRQFSFVFLFLYFLALAFSWFRYAPLICLWILTSLIVSSYASCESLQILREYEKDIHKFLWNKWFQLVKWISLVYAPVLIIQLLWNQEIWYVPLVFMVIQYFLIALAVFYKYANYWPNQQTSTNNFLISFCILGGLIPFIAPVPIVLTPVYFFKAKQRLKHFIYD